MLACAGDDLVWLGQLRQLLATLFSEGLLAYAAGTPIGNRLLHYREAQTQFNAALDTLVLEVRLRRESLDTASDYFSAVQNLLQRIPASGETLPTNDAATSSNAANLAIGVSPSQFVTFSNYISQFFVAVPFFDPTAGQTQQIVATFPENTCWRLTVLNYQDTPARAKTDGRVKIPHGREEPAPAF